MEEIKRQVGRARRRLNFAEFLRMVSRSLTAALAVALIGPVIPRLWAIGVSAEVWTWTWIGGSLVAGLLIGWLIAFLRRRNDLDAAMELDRRCGLKERISSSLGLTLEERASAFGQALLIDAASRVERIDVGEQFAVPVSNWRNLLPLVPALAMFVIVFFVPLAQPKVTASPENRGPAKDQRIKAARQLEQRSTERRREMAERGLKETEAVFDELAQQAQQLKTGDAVDRKETLVRLNDLTEKLQNRKRELATNEQFKKQLENLENLQRGPADQMAEALRQGNVDQAAKEFDNLIERLKNGDLRQQDAEKLARQIEQLKDLLARHKQKRQLLEDAIRKAKNDGDPVAAAKMQEQLDRLKAEDKQRDEDGALDRLAEKLGNAAEQLKRQKANQQDAAQAMQDAGQELQELAEQLAESEAVDDALRQIEAVKDALQNGSQAHDKPGNSEGGSGPGSGDRAEEKTNTKGYHDRIRGNVGKGRSEISGRLDGPNLRGRSRQATSDEVSASLTKAPDPIDDTGLPRAQRNHSKEYFQKLLQGE